MVEGPQIYIPGKDLLVAATTGQGLQGDGAEVRDGEIAHPDGDHALHMGEKETGIGIETGVAIVTERGSGIKIETMIGTEKRREEEEVTERLKNELIGFQCQRKRL